MRSIKSALFHGFLVWLIPFIFGFLLFPIHESDRILFESIMPVVVTISAVLFTFLYLKKQKSNYFKEGILLGITWFIINIAIDLLLFMWGPMKMTFLAYMSDIGLTYLIIPIITIGIGALIENKKE
ncbi:hypothetical protein J4440_07005 [Candidatus Woesearchaeota archaeon]|nr:hypothetical protein [Candidatus Woesearchaeota archaeon]